MPQLNQIIAVEKGEKSRAFEAFAQIDRRLSRAEPLTGIARTYTPRDDDGEQLPPESKRVQYTAAEGLTEAAEALARLFNITATKEWANTTATADIVVDGTTLLSNVPVTYMLFLERQLVDIRTFVGRLPTLTPGVKWEWDETQSAYASGAVSTFKTKKVPRNHVLWEPPDPSYKQVAQVETYHEDVVVGDWRKIDYSGALPRDRVREISGRVDALLRAVKYAREQANSVEVDNVSIGEQVFDYLFGQ